MAREEALRSGPATLDDKHFCREQLHGGKATALERYCRLVLGRKSLPGLVKYEILTSLVGPFPGAAGLALRKLLYPLLFRKIGKGVVFGRNVTIRCPENMEIGDGVVIDDYCLLDARGAGEEKLRIGKRVIVNRGCVIQSKLGPLHIGDDVTIGTGSIIVAQGGVFLGDWVSLAGGCKVSGGLFEPRPPGDASLPPYRRHTKGPIRIGRGSVLAFGAVVLDGVHVGEGSMVGPGAVLFQDLPAGAVASPRPAVILRRAPEEVAGS